MPIVTVSPNRQKHLRATGVGLILRRIDLLFRGSKRYFYPLGRKVCLLAPRFIAQWTKICAMTPANATTKVFPIRRIKPIPQTAGFTLCELLIVLAIMTTALAFVVPHMTRSNSGLKTDDLCQDIASATNYAMDCAVRAAIPVRLIISPRSRYIRLEQAQDISGGMYAAMAGTPGQPRFFDERVYITDMDGFDALDSDRYALVFDPRKPWPKAEIAIASNHVARRVFIRGPLADIQPTDL